MERNHNTPGPPGSDLRLLFRAHSILTLEELKSALGTQVAMTVFRKLRPLGYLSSYSHRGKYYTLNEIARFDQLGLWSHHQVRFSRHRTLINTCAVLVADSEAGYTADELDHLLHVQVKDPLRKLALQGRIRRSKVGARWVHFSADSKRYQAQLRARHIGEAASTATSVSSVGAVVPDELHAAIILFYSLLDERQRRLYAALESLKIGHGGDRRIAELLGLDAGTVARGRQQLLAGDVQRQRVRRPRWRAPPGGKKTPEVIAAIEAALKHDVAGEPITGIRWTRRTTEKIAQELAALDIQVCPRTVARILKDLGYRLRVNHKRVAAGSGPDRDEQFQHIAAQRLRFAERGLPIVSIDTKKRELVGNFKNHGTTWERSPLAVNDHDFRSQADGIAIPYGIYDLTANRGFVVVGTSHDTPDFAADNLLRWWQAEGLQHYPRARELLVLADSGGSNSPRIRCFKYALQTRLVDPHRLKVTVCHYPGGASKWNPIDHRLFSEISKNWAGVPLTDYETILNHIRTTTTDTGLSVVAQLVEQEYPTGVKIADAEFASIALQPHQTRPLRNYTICPRS